MTIRPKSAIAAGAGLPAGVANQPYTITLNKGEYAQITQFAPLSGSPISADKPIGVFGGHTIMSIDRCCGDHGEQMLAPVQALGSVYVAAPHPDRKAPGEVRVYRIYGARRRSTSARSSRSAARCRSRCAARTSRTRSRCSRT